MKNFSDGRGSNIMFLDNHELFYEYADRYNRDGLHLNDYGSKTLANNIRKTLDVSVKES